MIPPITMKRPVLCRYSLAFSANKDKHKKIFFKCFIVQDVVSHGSMFAAGWFTYKQIPNLWQSYAELSLKTVMEKHSS